MSNTSLSSVGRSGTGTPTASAIMARAEPVSGSHVLKIDGYSRTKGLGIGKCITSESFTVGGRRWCLKYYPDGSNNYYAGSISIFLCLDHTDNVNEVNARCKISLLDQDGEPVPEYSKDSKTCYTFSSNTNGSWDYAQLITRKNLEESAYLKDDVFSIKCEVTVPKEIFTEPTSLLAAVPPSDIHQHLGRLLLGGEGSDVTFKVGGETFFAHRWLLAARSSVFMAEFFSPMKEKTADCVKINDMEAKVFKAMLHFIYTDSLPYIDDDDAATMSQHLLVAADRYNLERLKLICVEKLSNLLDTNTAATTLALAEQHSCRGLKAICFKFLASRGNILKAVMASDGFEHLRSSCPSVLKELVAKLAPRDP